MVKAYKQMIKVEINGEIVYDRLDKIILSEALIINNVAHVDFDWSSIDAFSATYPMYAICKQKRKYKILKLYNPRISEIVSYRDDVDKLQIRQEVYFKSYTPSINELFEMKDELAIKYLAQRIKKFWEFP